MRRSSRPQLHKLEKNLGYPLSLSFFAKLPKTAKPQKMRTHFFKTAIRILI